MRPKESGHLKRSLEVEPSKAQTKCLVTPENQNAGFVAGWPLPLKTGQLWYFLDEGNMPGHQRTIGLANRNGVAATVNLIFGRSK